jgi:hypothetical protein
VTQGSSEDWIATRVRAPSYGRGYFFRAWRMRRVSSTRLEVTMEDPSHALAVLLDHDECSILDIKGRWIRAPLSSCHGSGDALEAMIGCVIADDLHKISGYVAAGLQCTHMLDSVRLGVVHLATNRPDRRYDVVVPDGEHCDREIELMTDGEVTLRLGISADYRMLYPDPYSGLSLFKGLARAAQARFDARQYEDIFMVQRAAFVSRGAMVDTEYYYHRPAPELGPPSGTCFGSQPGRFEQAVRNPTFRAGLVREEALQFEY